MTLYITHIRRGEGGLPIGKKGGDSRECSAEIPKVYVYYLDGSQRPLMAVP